MNKSLVIIALAAWVAACSALPNALDSESSNQDALIIEHKLSISDSGAAKQQRDADYYASAEYRNARHANQFIRDSRGQI